MAWNIIGNVLLFLSGALIGGYAVFWWVMACVHKAGIRRWEESGHSGEQTPAEFLKAAERGFFDGEAYRRWKSVAITTLFVAGAVAAACAWFDAPGWLAPAGLMAVAAIAWASSCLPVSYD